MKSVIRQIVFNLVILWILAGLIHEITYSDFTGLLISALLLSFIQILIYPLINLLFTPINLVTLGTLKSLPWLFSLILFNWLSVFYKIEPITIPSIQYGTLNLPTLHLGWISTIILFSVIYTLLYKLLYWLSHTDE